MDEKGGAKMLVLKIILSVVGTLGILYLVTYFDSAMQWLVTRPDRHVKCREKADYPDYTPTL